MTSARQQPGAPTRCVLPGSSSRLSPCRPSALHAGPTRRRPDLSRAQTEPFRWSPGPRCSLLWSSDPGGCVSAWASSPTVPHHKMCPGPMAPSSRCSWGCLRQRTLETALGSDDPGAVSISPSGVVHPGTYDAVHAEDHGPVSPTLQPPMRAPRIALARPALGTADSRFRGRLLGATDFRDGGTPSAFPSRGAP